jgi:hypothetical protein
MFWDQNFFFFPFQIFILSPLGLYSGGRILPHRCAIAFEFMDLRINVVSSTASRLFPSWIFLRHFRGRGISILKPLSWLCHDLQSLHNQLTHSRNIPSAVFAAPPEDEQVMLETFRGPWFSINWMKSASRWFHYTETQYQFTRRHIPEHLSLAGLSAGLWLRPNLTDLCVGLWASLEQRQSS